MVRLDLTVDEAEVLRHLLHTRLAEMRKEISHTATREFRDKLKKEEALVERLLQELAAPVRA